MPSLDQSQESNLRSMKQNHDMLLKKVLQLLDTYQS